LKRGTSSETNLGIFISLIAFMIILTSCYISSCSISLAESSF
jgi:hypothetical protein